MAKATRLTHNRHRIPAAFSPIAKIITGGSAGWRWIGDLTSEGLSSVRLGRLVRAAKLSQTFFDEASRVRSRPPASTSGDFLISVFLSIFGPCRRAIEVREHQQYISKKQCIAAKLVVSHPRLRFDRDICTARVTN